MLTSQLSVYPNPTKEILYVELEGEELEEIVLRDVNGRVILSSNASETITWELNLTSFPIGMYLLEVKGKNGYRESQQVEKN
jgi:predicted regulator of Ras-like GTPase activity (Roadblock/LC7/MglB family)